MRKEEALNHWEAIEPNQPIKPEPIEYKHEGSTYDRFGIRVTGTQAEIDSVLSRLKDLLEFENGDTRLQLVYQQSNDRKTGKPINGWNCYVQVHCRTGGAHPSMHGYSDLALRNDAKRHAARKTQRAFVKRAKMPELSMA